MGAQGIEQAIEELIPEITARREEVEAARRIPPDLVERLTATGMFRLAVPRVHGGEELDPVSQTVLIERLSAADGSTGWCAMIAIGDGIFAGYMPDVGVKEVFADPARPTAASIGPVGAAVPVDGGYVVSGRWRFASGIDHCDWLLGGCVVTDDGAPRLGAGGLPEIVHVFMPKADCRVDDTWYAMGLSGTGSNDFETTELFVPERRAMSIFDPATHRLEPLYQMPLLPLFAPQVSAVGLGVARAAIDELTALATTKTPSLSAARLADKPVMQVELAKAETHLGAARAFLFETMGAVWDAVVAGRAVTPRQHALTRAAAVHASQTAAEVTRTAATLGGGTSIYLSSSLQRHFRDAQAVTHHVSQSLQTWEESGRVLLGLAPTFPIF